ncbi:MAG: SLATT domain-containing protein [Loktanella sp.]|nr:SLATT domain-containing protein [Loktanella sp.]
MNAEKRSRFLELYFHIVLALFALASICISVVGDTQNIRLNENIFSFTSITTLSLSLLIFGFKFGETAANHRSCYLSLQKMRGSNESDDHKLEENYINVLSFHPNHTTGDYMRLAISNIFEDEQNLTSPDGNKVCIGWWRRLSYVTSWFLSRVLILAFAAMPFIIVGYGIDFTSVLNR